MKRWLNRLKKLEIYKKLKYGGLINENNQSQ